MSELYLVKTCRLEKARKMLYSVLCEAVSDEEDAELGLTLAGIFFYARYRSDLKRFGKS